MQQCWSRQHSRSWGDCRKTEARLCCNCFIWCMNWQLQLEAWRKCKKLKTKDTGPAISSNCRLKIVCVCRILFLCRISSVVCMYVYVYIQQMGSSLNQALHNDRISWHFYKDPHIISAALNRIWKSVIHNFLHVPLHVCLLYILTH